MELLLRIAWLLLALAIAGPAAAQDMDYSERKEGWFWYQDPAPVPEIEEPDPQEPEIPHTLVLKGEESTETPAQENGTSPPIMSVEWLRENLPVALDAAVNDPDDTDKVRAWAYMRRAMFDKSERFAYAVQRVTLSDPLLDENNRFPISTFGAMAQRARSRDQNQRTLKWLSENAGFFYFHDDACRYCQQQLPILLEAQEKHNLQFMAIATGESILDVPGLEARMDNGHAQRFRVSTVPAIVMVWPPDNAAVLSQNLVSLNGLQNRAIAIAEEMGLLSRDVKESLGIESPEYITEANLDDLEDDPSAWIQRIRQEFGYEDY